MNAIAQNLDSLITMEGFSQSNLDGISFYKSSSSIPCIPFMYQPSIVIVGQGRKIGRLNHQEYVYDSDHFLVLAIPMSYECEIISEPDESFLALTIDIDTTMLHEIYSNIETPIEARFDDTDENLKNGLQSVKIDKNMKKTIIRLLEVLHDKEECRILGKSLINELIYRVMKGNHAPALLALIEHNSNFSRVARIIHYIYKNYQINPSIDDLAKMANMSEASFFRHFKNATSCTPIQYIKKNKLNKAKDFLQMEKLSVKETSSKTGYESVSQFSREYKRLFGKSPSEEKRIFTN